jgi:hypothetical protein
MVETKAQTGKNLPAKTQEVSCNHNRAQWQACPWLSCILYWALYLLILPGHVFSSMWWPHVHYSEFFPVVRHWMLSWSPIPWDSIPTHISIYANLVPIFMELDKAQPCTADPLSLGCLFLELGPLTYISMGA